MPSTARGAYVLAFHGHYYCVFFAPQLAKTKPALGFDATLPSLFSMSALANQAFAFEENRNQTCSDEILSSGEAKNPGGAMLRLPS